MRSNSYEKINLRWFERVFQGQYFPSLSINYVAINKDLKKLPPQLYYIKMKICYNQGYNDIGTVTITKWPHDLFYLLPYFSALGTVLVGASFSSNSRLNVREVKQNLGGKKVLSTILEEQFLVPRNTAASKIGNAWTFRHFVAMTTTMSW